MGREATKSRQRRAVRLAQRGRPLGVDGDRQAERGGALHAGLEHLVVDGREVLDPAVAHEGLEADDAALGQLVEPVEVARHEPAPEREVDHRGGPVAASTLASKAAPSIVGGWALSGISMQAVAPPARERAAAGRPALPVGAARAR